MWEQPVVRIVRGDPTAEEVAALVAALRTRPTQASDPALEPTRDPAAPPRPSRWARSARPGTTGRPGPGAWRAAARSR